MSLNFLSSSWSMTLNNNNNNNNNNNKHPIDIISATKELNPSPNQKQGEKKTENQKLSSITCI